MKSIISMKKHISLILTGLLIAVMVNAQTPETLTNSSVIKMSKANLSDELITDMIQNSPVKFDLSESALKKLAGEGVSTSIIQSMKSAEGASKSSAEKPATASGEKATPASGTKEPEAIETATAYTPSVAKKTVSVEALNYVAPLTELIKFNETKFKALETTITEWDKQVRGNVADVNKVKSQMLQVENELRQKKNADTKAFSSDIISLKGKLEAYRKNYEQSKDIMLKDGDNIVKGLETLKSDVISDISKAYSDAGQQVGSADSDPAAGENAITVNYTVREINNNAAGYIVFLTEMLAWHQNEIRELNTVINDWNPRVTKIIQEDALLKEQLDPVEQKLKELSTNSKLNKAEISTLKKKASEIEKSRKQLADQMKDDAKVLASYLKQMSQKNQDAVEERFTDIIENITYSFQEKLSL
jgi:predicted  nucleic acid-binding Zn-ribbon protein